MREYAKMKEEKEAEQRRREEEAQEDARQQEEAEAETGNPLMDASYSLKRKWYEETVFRNQARREAPQKKRFINDTVRSDFHRKFMSKYVQ
mmetsp:Transcript_16436/g.25387  ORF Transcript_16436/g.25387 Transcript_16436/m.25387 type:complete len:91 (+) Transcript_16436:480-752(+)